MNDSDVLARAARALRQAHDGERAASGFTRARIMNALHRERRRRLVRWAVFSPLVSLLLVGSAWAQSTGSWPVLWQAVRAVFSAAPAPEAPTSRAPTSRAPRGQSERAPRDVPPAAPAPEAAPPESPPEESLPEAVPPAPALEPARERPRAPRRRPAPAAEAREAAPASAAARELASFRAAHDLHFRGDRPREALAAYEAYLREYPRGRFVPEARYNGALDRIKLGDHAGAREALAPFAAGELGGYRQREARELLEALR